MPQSILKPEAVENMRPFFVGRDEPNYSAGQIIPTYTMMHGARAFFIWSRNPTANADNLSDLWFGPLDEQGGCQRGTEGLMTYGIFDGGDDYYWEGASTTNYHFYGSLSAVAWVRFDADALGGITTVFSRWRTGTNNRSYWLYKNANDVLVFSISVDGTNVTTVTSTLTVTSDVWYFVGIRHTASTEMAIWVSNPTTKKLNEDLNTTSIPASSFPTGAAEFNIGARNNSAGVHTDYLFGDIALLWLGAYATPYPQIWNAYQLARPLLSL